MAIRYTLSSHALVVATLSSLIVIISNSSSLAASPAYRYQLPQYGPNDLYSSSAEANPAHKSPLVMSSVSQQNLMNDKQHQQQQQQQQQQQTTFKSTAGSRPVINGNHATYVEPPADFKPIIYEPERQLEQDSSSSSSSSAQQLLLPGGPHVAYNYGNQDNIETQAKQLPRQVEGLVASRFPPASRVLDGQVASGFSSRQQQKRQTEAPVLLQESSENQISRANVNANQESATESLVADGNNSDPAQARGDEGDDEPNMLPMKPSIDRWSDWHDMSVDPDLASSDTQLAPTSALLHASQDKSAAPSTIEGTFRESSQSRLHSQQVQPAAQQQQQLDLGGQQQQQQQRVQMKPMDTFRANDQATRFSASDAHQERAYHLAQSAGNLIAAQPRYAQDYRLHQANNLQQQQQQLANSEASSYQRHASAAVAAPVAAQPFYYVLQHQPSVHQMHAGLAEQQRYDQATRSNFMASVDPSRNAFVPHVMMPLPLMAAAAAPPPPPAVMLLHRRYGKKMVNLFKVANNNNNNHHHQQQQQQQQQHRTMSLGKGPKRLAKSTQTLMNTQNAEVRVLALREQRLNSPLVSQPPASSSSPEMSAHLGKKVSLGGSAPVANRVITLANAQGQRSLVRQQVSGGTNASAPVNSTINSAPKRILKRRRIKTLVPVGLSSWFLGGIRDLDARHWKLPADVISKLAVNDVDLQHSEQPTPFVGAPASQDDMVNISNQVQSGGSLEKADAPRASTTRSPANQPLSPR